MKNKRIWTSAISVILLFVLVFAGRISKIDFSFGKSSIAGAGKGVNQKVASMDDLLTVFKICRSMNGRTALMSANTNTENSKNTVFDPNSVTVIMSGKEIVEEIEGKGNEKVNSKIKITSDDFRYYISEGKFAVRAKAKMEQEVEAGLESASVVIDMDAEFFYDGKETYIYYHYFEAYFSDGSWMKLSSKNGIWLSLSDVSLSIDPNDLSEDTMKWIGDFGNILDFFIDVEEISTETKKFSISKKQWKETVNKYNKTLPDPWDDYNECSLKIDISSSTKPEVGLSVKSGYQEDTMTANYHMKFVNIGNTVIDFNYDKAKDLWGDDDMLDYWDYQMGGSLFS